MNVEYIAQPEHQLGRILTALLDAEPNKAVFVSAFVGIQTLMRMKDQVIALREKPSDVRFVIGIDLGGTSQDVLRELLNWNVEVLIVKHRIAGHTFHPKLYVFQWDDKAEIIIGSNNITEGGFFGNYEGAARITYKLPGDLAEFETACAALRPFIHPDGPVVYYLTEEFLRELIGRSQVPTEAEARRRRRITSRQTGKKPDTDAEKGHLFGVEDIEPPPPLPAELLERLVKAVRRRRMARKQARKERAAAAEPPVDDKVTDALFAGAFYMILPTLQGDNIPGEGRIPLEAIELAKGFWGWPDEYTKDVSPRAGRARVYWNWRPTWRLWSAEAPDNVAVQEVRMYMYENSSDFRFYARAIVNAGGDLGDVVRIQRIAQPDAEYECVLARKGTAEYNQWVKYCTQPVRNSTRRFGYG